MSAWFEKLVSRETDEMKTRCARFLDRPIARYATAVVVIGVAFLLRRAFSGVFGSGLTYITFYPAVMLVATLAGFRAGLLATGIAALLAAVWILPPVRRLESMNSPDAIGLAVFSIMGVFMSSVAGLYHRALQRAAEYEKKLALRESEEALQDSEDRFRTMADSIPQLAWMADPDGAIFWYNLRWYEYTGTTPRQMEGWGWQSVHDQEMLPKVLERWNASIATGQPFDMEFPLLGADGEFRWFLTRVMPMKDPEGRVARWFGTNTDISEKRELDAHKQEFYRRTIQAATQGKLVMSEPEEIREIAGPTEAAFEIECLGDVGVVRDAVLEMARRSGMDESRVYEFAGCAVEAAANVHKHAGKGTASLHHVPNGLLLMVSDHGRGIGTMALPDVALRKGYSTAGTLGMGYKVMIEFADKVYLATGVEGTTVAIQMDLHKGKSSPAGVAAPGVSGRTS